MDIKNLILEELEFITNNYSEIYDQLPLPKGRGLMNEQ